MGVIPAGLHSGKAAVQRVRSCAAHTFHTQPAEQGVGLDNVFKRLGTGAGFGSLFGLQAVLKQHLVAQLRHRHPCQGRAVALSNAVGGVGLQMRPGLKISGQGIAHAGYQQTDRRLRDDFAVDQNEVGIAFEVDGLSVDTLLGVGN